MTFEDLLVWDIVFGLASFAVILSNSLAIFIFTRRRFRRKLTHYLPINLAVTDLVVGTLALPLYIILLNSPGDTLNWIYLSIDIIAGVTSVASIALISLERLCAIGCPWKHRLLKRKHYAVGIMSTWVYAIVFMFLIRFVAALNGIVIMGVHILIWDMGVPLLITVVSCIMICIMKKRSQRSLRQRPNVHKDNKLVKTLLMITVVFWLTWLPYTVLSVIVTYSCLKGKCYDVPLLMLLLLKFLHYSSSFANPIIYVFRVDAFRLMLREICCNGRKNLKVNRVLPAVSQKSDRLELQELQIDNATTMCQLRNIKEATSF